MKNHFNNNLIMTEEEEKQFQLTKLIGCVKKSLKTNR